MNHPRVCRRCRSRLINVVRAVPVEGLGLAVNAQVKILGVCGQGRSASGEDRPGRTRCGDLLSGPVRGEIRSRTTLALVSKLVCDADRLRPVEVHFVRSTIGDSQIEFASRFSVSRSTVLRWERTSGLLPHLESYAVRAAAAAWLREKLGKGRAFRPSFEMPPSARRFAEEPNRDEISVDLHVRWRGYAPGPPPRDRAIWGE